MADHLRLKNSLGSPNTLTPSHVCRGPNAAATTLSVGHHLRGDYANSACQVYWGKNEAWAHPAFLMHAVVDDFVNRGAKLIVVDPRYEHPFAHKADIYLPVRPGSDAALMLSWINVILEEGLYDAEFVTNWTDGPALVYTDTLELVKEGDVRTGGETRDFVPYPGVGGRPPQPAPARGVGRGRRSFRDSRRTGRAAGAVRGLRTERPGVQACAATAARAGCRLHSREGR